MDKKLEQAAIYYTQSEVKGMIDHDIDTGDMKWAFIAGANWQKEQSPWISIDERFPDDKEQVLVSSKIYGKVVLTWDDLYIAWVYPDDNDVIYCNWDKVDCWMPIPK